MEFSLCLVRIIESRHPVENRESGLDRPQAVPETKLVLGLGELCNTGIDLGPILIGECDDCSYIPLLLHKP
jgi:hypothetical protein